MMFLNSQIKYFPIILLTILFVGCNGAEFTGSKSKTAKQPTPEISCNPDTEDCSTDTDSPIVDEPNGDDNGGDCNEGTCDGDKSPKPEYPDQDECDLNSYDCEPDCDELLIIEDYEAYDLYCEDHDGKNPSHPDEDGPDKDDDHSQDDNPGQNDDPSQSDNPSQH